MKNTPFSTYTLSYADWRDYKIHMVNMSYRDLQIIVDVLDDYSWLLQNAPCRSATGWPMLSASTSPTPNAKSTWKSSRRPRMMSEERR